MINQTKHYVRLNEQNYIIKGFSTAFEQPLETDICINEDGGRHFEMFGVVNLALKNEKNICLYKYTDKVEKRTELEIQAEESLIVIPKTEMEKMNEIINMLLMDSLGV